MAENTQLIMLESPVQLASNREENVNISISVWNIRVWTQCTFSFDLRYINFSHPRRYQSSQLNTHWLFLKQPGQKHQPFQCLLSQLYVDPPAQRPKTKYVSLLSNYQFQYHIPNWTFAHQIFGWKDTQVPFWVRPYVHAVSDPLGDGHCGYRAIAISLGLPEAQWNQVRGDLMAELEANSEFYEAHFKEHQRDYGGVADHITCLKTSKPNVLKYPLSGLMEDRWCILWLPLIGVWYVSMVPRILTIPPCL